MELSNKRILPLNGFWQVNWSRISVNCLVDSIGNFVLEHRYVVTIKLLPSYVPGLCFCVLIHFYPFLTVSIFVYDHSYKNLHFLNHQSWDVKLKLKAVPLIFLVIYIYILPNLSNQNWIFQKEIKSISSEKQSSTKEGTCSVPPISKIASTNHEMSWCRCC